MVYRMFFLGHKFVFGLLCVGGIADFFPAVPVESAAYEYSQ